MFYVQIKVLTVQDFISDSTENVLNIAYDKIPRLGSNFFLDENVLIAFPTQTKKKSTNLIKCEEGQRQVDRFEGMNTTKVL